MIEGQYRPARPGAIEMIRSEIRDTPLREDELLPATDLIEITVKGIGRGKKKAGSALKTEQAPAAPAPLPQPPPGSLAGGDKMIDIKTANQWLDEQRLKPAPKKLFGAFWLEGELCILFADTNMGKSILAVQIGDSISRREATFPFEQDAMGAPVLYIDFELSAKQFELRYHDAEGAHRFSDWFYRAEYNTQKEMPAHYTSFDDYMQATLAWAIRNTEPKTLIIDNITCLSEGNHQTTGRAISLMKYLKALQVKNKLSILVLAHTPKRAAGKPLSRDDMGGSKMLMNFADSAFAIGQSCAPGGLRYLKQVKQRSGGQQYGGDNICLMKLARKSGFLHYEFCGFGYEGEHLRRQKLPLTDGVAPQVMELHTQGISHRQIAKRLGIGFGSVGRILAKAGTGK